jgi:tRNA G18 (ribose-2'-O)-methylase SpoU
MPCVTSIAAADDPRIDVFRDVRDRDLRGRDQLFMAESELVLRRLLRTPDRLHSVLLSPAKLRRLEPVLANLPDSIPVFIADLDLIARIAGFHVHRGVLATGRRPDPASLSLDVALGHLRGRASLRLLVAEGITNVDNMGGLFRNAAAFGADGIVLDPSCCDPLYRKAIRVSMGHTLSVPWAICDGWPASLARLKADWGLTLVGAELTPTARPLGTLGHLPRAAIVLGSEGAGLSDAALAHCDEVCQIPMAAADASLNVAAASAVFLYGLGAPSPAPDSDGRSD